MLDGWVERSEFTAAIEEALEERKAEFDHLVDRETTADAINDLLMKTVPNAARLLLAKRPKDTEEFFEILRFETMTHR